MERYPLVRLRLAGFLVKRNARSHDLNCPRTGNSGPHRLQADLHFPRAIDFPGVRNKITRMRLQNIVTVALLPEHGDGNFFQKIAAAFLELRGARGLYRINGPLPFNFGKGKFIRALLDRGGNRCRRLLGRLPGQPNIPQIHAHNDDSKQSCHSRRPSRVSLSFAGAHQD